jgi:hypothetical protein
MGLQGAMDGAARSTGATSTNVELLGLTGGGAPRGLSELGSCARSHGIAAVWAVAAFFLARCAVAFGGVREESPADLAGLASDDAARR